MKCPYCQGQMIEKGGICTGLITYYCLVAGKACRSTVAERSA